MIRDTDMLTKCLILSVLTVSGEFSFALSRQVLSSESGQLYGSSGTASALPKGFKIQSDSKLLQRLAYLQGADSLRLVFVGDSELYGLFTSVCSILNAEITASHDESLPAPCAREDLGIVLAFVPSVCGQLTPFGRGLLQRFGSSAGEMQPDMHDRPHSETVAVRTIVLLNYGKELLHLGAQLPMKCSARAGDFTEAVDQLLTSTRKALLPAIPDAIVFMGPTALCVDHLPPRLAAAVHDAQSANRRRSAALIDQCASATGDAAAAGADHSAIATSTATDAVTAASARPRSVNAAAAAAASLAAATFADEDVATSLWTLCADGLLTASAVEELNAESQGALRLVADRWGPLWERRLSFADVHRLTKGRCALAVHAASVAAATVAAAAARPAAAIALAVTVAAARGAAREPVDGLQQRHEGGMRAEAFTATGAEAGLPSPERAGPQGMDAEWAAAGRASQYFPALAAEQLLAALSGLPAAQKRW